MRREESSETYGYERFISTDNIRVVHDFLKIVITAPPYESPFLSFKKKYITSSVNTAYQVRNYRYRRSERDLEEEERTACY